MKNMKSAVKALRELAKGYPESHEGIACAGTAVERRTFKARNKAFLFLGATDAMFKLGASLTEATRLASKEPDRIRVGANGWVKVIFSSDGSGSPPLDVLERWIDESYRLLAPKALAESLPARGIPARNSRTVAARRAPRPRSGKKR